MQCTSPEKYYKRDPAKFDGVGGLTKDARKALVNGSTVTVACGRCVNCRLSYAYEWSLRAMHEVKTSMMRSNLPSIFVTFTYDDEHLPVGGSLHYRDYQLFMHKLRKSGPGRGRFLMCGEYGEVTWRPHYHAILFGTDFEDKKFYKYVDGIPYYTSAELSALWQNGHVTYSDATLASCGYVARYSMKKITGDAAVEYYGDLVPPFLKSSNRPGIGYEWFQRYHSDVFPCDYLVHGGKKFPVPRYYLKLLDAMSSGDAELVKRSRREAMIGRKDHPDSTPRRLRDRWEFSVLTSQQKREMK